MTQSDNVYYMLGSMEVATTIMTSMIEIIEGHSESKLPHELGILYDDIIIDAYDIIQRLHTIIADMHSTIAYSEFDDDEDSIFIEKYREQIEEDE